MKGLYSIDAVTAIKETVFTLNAFQQQNRPYQDSEKLIAFVFCRLQEGSTMEFIKESDLSEIAYQLKELVLLVYQVISPYNDEKENKKRRIHTPSSRNKAESARQSLLSELTSLPSETTYNMLIELSNESACSIIKHDLKYWARKRATRDAEPTPYHPSAISTLIKENELPPNNHDSLFKVMMERLSYIQHDLDNHSFSIKDRWRECKREAQVQTLLEKECKRPATHTF